MPMRVVSSVLDPYKKDSDVSGPHTVLYPTSDAEVKDALTVAKVLGAQDVLVRSGRRAANNEYVDGTDAMVVNLRNYAGIEIDSYNTVTVCAGATTSDLAAMLKGSGLFLPLDGDQGKSVFSNTRPAERGFVPELSLGSFLTSSQGINKANLEIFDDVLYQNSDEHIVTKMIFKAKTADEVKGYRMTRRRFTYDRTFFNDVLRHVFFGEHKLVADDEMDVRVTVMTGANDMPLFMVTTICPHDSDYITEMIKTLDPGGGLIVDVSMLHGEERPTRDAPEGRERVIMETDLQKGADIAEELAQEGKGSQYFSDVPYTRYLGELTEDTLDAYVDAVHRSVASSPTPILPGIKILSNVSWKSQDGVSMVRVHMSVHAPLPKDQTSAEKAFHHDIAEAIHYSARADISGQVDVGRQDRMVKLDGLNTGKRADITIPGFSGEVYYKSSPDYTKKNTQYATSSYKDDSERMKPYAIGYPENTADVKAFVEYAIRQGKKVVVRSGGHQYCGLSSGGSDTMLLSMDCLNGLKVDTLETGEVMAQVGPGVHLTNLAAEFTRQGVTIPHGECINVCIGGHVQTGGYGHILRSYGLALDHVKSFDIVLAHPVVQLRTIARPTNKVQEGEESSTDDRIFWGVMGGGAGSFGVITNVEFACIKDSDHPDSRGYSGNYFYHKGVFKATMKVVQQRTVDVFDPKALPNDCDLMVSVISGSWRNPNRPAVVVVEMIHGNNTGLKLSDDDIGLVRMKKEIDDINASKPWWWPKLPVAFVPSSYTPLSSMSEAFVRNRGMTDTGREFDLPYVKRVNCTTKPLSDSFVEAFVDLCDKANDADGVSVIFQMVMGGGAYQRNGDKGISSIPHRDIVIGIVFDCFYTNGKGKISANELHNEFGALVESCWGEDIRVMWGSFGEIDMSKVHEEYYGKGNGLYERLQHLKQEVNPKDHFHTRFTVQLPTPSAVETGAGGGGADGGGDGGQPAGKRVKLTR